MREIRLLWTLMGVCVSLTGIALDIVEDGEAKVKILLPEKTEFDRYVNMTPEQMDAYLKKRFPNATEEKLAAARKVLPRMRKAEAKRVGDEEELAAEELIRFVKKMSGVELELQRWKNGEELPKGDFILLGAELARLKKLGETLDGLSQDGFITKVKGDYLVLAGKRARGTLYAVYDFLESQGCRWIMPGEFGELIPERSEIETRINVVKNPSHTQRYWWCTWGHGKEYPRWTLRNKGNFVRGLGDPSVRQNHASQVPLHYGATKTDRGILVKKKVRDWKRNEKGQIIRDEKGKPVERVWVEREVKQLPDEYYTLSGGKPNTHLGNMSNPKVWDLCTEYYRDVYFYSRPMEDYASISCADGLVIDDRKASRQLDSNEFDWTMGAPTATDRLWFFHRRYIDEVVKEHPDRKFGVLVYANNMTPPRLETVHPAMALVFAPLGICPLHHVRDVKCKTNRAYKDWFESWMAQKRASGAEGYYYDYLPIGFQWCNFIISPQWHIVGENYPWFHKLGLDGHTTQGFDDWGAMGLTAWVAQRLYWDVNQDYRELVAEYCRLRFGEPASHLMIDYYGVYEARMREIPDLCSNEIWGNHLAIDEATRKAAREILKKAGTRLVTDRHRAHFKTVDAYQRAMDAWCGGIDYARETGDFAGAAEKMEPAFAIAAELNTHYSHFVHPRRIDKATKVQFRPGGWYNKYKTWDAKVKAADVSLCLPRMMKVALDSGNIAWTKGWHLPDTSVSDLEFWDTTIVPDVKYQTQREVSAFFYRTDVKVPKAFGESKNVSLYFPSLIARGVQIWINGKAVEFDNGDYKDTVWRGPSYFWFNYDHQQSFDVTGYLEPGKRNTIAFRIFKSFDHAGSYDRTFLLGEGAE